MSGCDPNATELACIFEIGAASVTLAAGDEVTVVVEGINGSTYILVTQLSPM